jgi:hypothetical protein
MTVFTVTKVSQEAFPDSACPVLHGVELECIAVAGSNAQSGTVRLVFANPAEAARFKLGAKFEAVWRDTGEPVA